MKRARDTPETNILREGLETQIEARGVDNRYVIMSRQKQRIRSLVRRKKLTLTKPKKIHGIVRCRRGRIHTAVRLGDKRVDTEQENRLPKSEAENTSAMPVQPTGGRIQTAVGRRETGAGIQTAVKRDSSEKREVFLPKEKSHETVFDTSVPSKKMEYKGEIRTSLSPKIGTTVRQKAANVIEGNVRYLIKTRADNSTISDTGTEAAEAAVRNYRKAETVAKTATVAVYGAARTAESIKDTPKEIKRDVQKMRESIIRKNRENQLKKRKKSRVPIFFGKSEVSISDGVVAKKGKGLLLIAAAVGVILLFLVLLYGLLPMIAMVIISLFKWFIPDGTSTEAELIENYRQMVLNAETAVIANIDAEVGYVPEYRYDGSEITGLKQYAGITLDIDKDAVIAAAAAIQFEAGSDTLTEADISAIIHDFFEIKVTKTHGYCPGHDCKKRVERVPSTSSTAGGSDSESAVTGTDSVEYTEREVTYCDNPNHTYYDAEIEYREIGDVLDRLGFSSEQKELYEMYYGGLSSGGFLCSDSGSSSE